jgi:putative ATPase
MLVGGGDVRFLARRLVILASEDVGNADPRALMLAVAAAQACELVGLPECQFNLAQMVIYLACAPKSNSATTAIYEARQNVQEGRLIPVPRHLRDPHNMSSTQKTEYQYAHEFQDGIAAQDYLGVDKEYYRPTQRGFEAELTRRLEFIKERLHEQ